MSIIRKSGKTSWAFCRSKDSHYDYLAPDSCYRLTTADGGAPNSGYRLSTAAGYAGYEFNIIIVFKIILNLKVSSLESISGNEFCCLIDRMIL